MKRFAFTLFAITATWALCQTPTVAQDAPSEQTPFTWKTSGDTLEDFKVELVPTQPLDQSSAEACVRSFLALADGRDEAIGTLDGLETVIETVVSNELSNTVRKVFAEDSYSEPTLSEFEKRRHEPLGGSWEIEIVDDLKSLLENSSLESSPFRIRYLPDRGPFKDGDVGLLVRKPREQEGVPLEGEFQLAFQCRADEAGTWRIVRLMQRTHYSDATLYQQDRNLFAQYWRSVRYPFAESASTELPEMSLSFESKADLIDAFLRGVVDERARLRSQLVRMVHQAWLAAIKPLCDTATMTVIENDSPRTQLTHKVVGHEYDILEHRDDPTRVVVKMNGSSHAMWQFTLEEHNEGWRITRLEHRYVAKRLRDGVEVEFLEDAKSIWDVAKEPVLTSYQLPIFLVG